MFSYIYIVLSSPSNLESNTSTCNHFKVNGLLFYFLTVTKLIFLHCTQRVYKKGNNSNKLILVQTTTVYCWLFYIATNKRMVVDIFGNRIALFGNLKKY